MYLLFIVVAAPHMKAMELLWFGHQKIAAPISGEDMGPIKKFAINPIIERMLRLTKYMVKIHYQVDCKVIP